VIFKAKEVLHTLHTAIPKPKVLEQQFSILQNLSHRQQEIISILEASDGLKAADMLKQLKDAPSARTLRDDLLELKKLGLIDFRGRTRAIVWFKKQEK
jgi:ATP-dependent DNA helicase RecG